MLVEDYSLNLLPDLDQTCLEHAEKVSGGVKSRLKASTEHLDGTTNTDDQRPNMGERTVHGKGALIE